MEANIFTVYTTAELFLNYCNSSQTWTFATAAIFGYGQIILEYFMHARQAAGGANKQGKGFGWVTYFYAYFWEVLWLFCGNVILPFE